MLIHVAFLLFVDWKLWLNYYEHWPVCRTMGSNLITDQLITMIAVATQLGALLLGSSKDLLAQCRDIIESGIRPWCWQLGSPNGTVL